MHEISIDMTLARHDPTDTPKPYFTQLEGRAVFGDVYDEIPDSEKAVTSSPLTNFHSFLDLS